MKNPIAYRAIIAALLTFAGSAAVHAAAQTANVGRATYERWCSHCHDPGLHHPGTNALAAKYKGIKGGVIREWKDLTPELVRFWVRTGISVMPPFRKTEISDAQLVALAQYLTSQTATAPR